ncbi:hypothetical protein PoB_007233800 [Plakobranchus ocellatus]|uniref:Uncharacterized protein n=1 Tax=Plakobranchus ocellatus TaxID=259542 RepID=A0AAV4DP42_9GAST|nr:hypothetical protein PoB_007233800 [Plakobranchus ocellatus]
MSSPLCRAGFGVVWVSELVLHYAGTSCYRFRFAVLESEPETRDGKKRRKRVSKRLPTLSRFDSGNRHIVFEKGIVSRVELVVTSPRHLREVSCLGFEQLHYQCEMSASETRRKRRRLYGQFIIGENSTRANSVMSEHHPLKY